MEYGVRSTFLLLYPPEMPFTPGPHVDAMHKKLINLARRCGLDITYPLLPSFLKNGDMGKGKGKGNNPPWSKRRFLYLLPNAFGSLGLLDDGSLGFLGSLKLS